LRTHLGVEERNLAGESAQRLLRQIHTGQAPRLALVFVPLMQGGGQDGIIRHWLKLACQETDQEKRQALGLVLVLAERSGCGPAWRSRTLQAFRQQAAL
jgi:hypothetical protein